MFLHLFHVNRGTKTCKTRELSVYPIVNISQVLPSCKLKSVSVTIEQSEPIKTQKNETTTYDCYLILPEIDAILFQERSEIFMKKTDILGSIFNMNCSEFASVLYQTFSKVIPSGSNDDKKFSNSF